MNISINVSDFNTICRLCLQKQEDPLIIFTTEIIYMIESCSSVQENCVNKKQWPQQICCNCYTCLKNAYEFKQQYFKSTQILTEIILKAQTQTQLNECEKVIKTEVKQENDDNFEQYEQQQEYKLYVEDFNTNCKNVDDTNSANTQLNNNKDSDDSVETILEDKNEEELEELNDDELRDKKRSCLQKNNKTQKNEYVCNVCGKKFKQQRYVGVHMLTHSNARPYACAECGKTFKYKFVYKAHKREKHDEPERREICFICGMQFTRTDLNRHMSKHRHPTNTDERFKCNECACEYSSVYSLRKHIYEKHTEAINLRFKCDICDKICASKNLLYQHKKYMHIDGRNFKCEYCDKTYKSKSHRKVHMDAVHKDIRPHPCTECKKAFHTKFLLKKHMVCHTGERAHSCEICGKSFGTRSVLKTHQKIHSKNQ